MTIKELEKIVGRDFICDDPATLKSYSQDRSFFKPRSPSFVVKPKKTEEIQAIVQLANKSRTPIIPVSSGVHFYGATIPHQGGIILDLQRMNTIKKIDKRNRAVRFEPGVTWGQLQKDLKGHRLMPLTPLLPHSLASALTSTLEREPMLIPITEYGEPILTMEVVLPNGKIFRTGSAAVGPPEETQTDMVGQSGPGLDWFRLFQGTQGTFCIVTWINMKAPPLPKKEKVFFVAFQKIEKVIGPLYTVLRRMLGAECFLLNRFNLASILAKKQPEDFKLLQKTLPPYTLVLNLSGGTVLPKDKIDYQEADLKEIARYYKLNLRCDLPGANTAKGITILNLLRSSRRKNPYWKDSFKERCCDIFFYTTLDRVDFFTRLVSRAASAGGYAPKEMGLYLQPLEGGRACYLQFGFPWNSHEKENVYDLYVKLSRSLINEGAFFGRPYGLWPELVYNRNNALTTTLRNLKKILDPNQIMNPGKLCY